MISASPSVRDRFAQLLRGEPVTLRTFGLTADAFLRACADEDLTGLVYQRLCEEHDPTGWPASLLDSLARHVRGEAAAELARRAELVSVLDVLNASAVHPFLFKGTPLAYMLYASPHLRPRCDTDLLIPHTQLEAATAALRSLGYASPPYCDGDLLFGQVVFARTDAAGVTHVVDLHWKLSTQAAIADLLTYDDIVAQAVPVPALGSSARATSLMHALLVACVHGVVHHRNVERLLWIHDIHVLVSRMRPEALDTFADLAIARRVAAVCRHSLGVARDRLATNVPDQVMERLQAAGFDGPSAAYLRPGRRWQHEQVSNLASLTWADRLRLARQVLFPSPSYMRRRYGLEAASFTTLLLPALYVHRTVRGGVDVLRGRK